jgi:putative endonuclease
VRRRKLPHVAWFVYLARCADDSLYCGITNDLVARLAAHNAGKGARYTRTRRPIEIVVTRRCASKGRALRLEHRIKQMSRAAKQVLVAEPARLTGLTSRRR